jgi:TolB-like protein/DNA-binding winged helix-turn-helix (wHTH) protein/Tfp pilus assembly protein PilF
MPEKGTTPGSIRFGPFELLPETQELRKLGFPVKLSGQAIQVLLVLTACPGKLVTREELQQKLWPGASFGDFDRGLNAAVSKLREKLSDSAIEPKYVETLPGRGYRFIGRVEPASEDQDDSRGALLAPSGGAPATPTQLSSFLKPISLATAGLAAVLGVCLYWFLATHPPIRSLAVLPFSSKGGDLEYLSDGITDSLIDSVSQLPRVKVISHTSAFHYKGQPIDPRTVGRELGVGALLMGTIVTRGDILLVNVELVNTNDNTHIWGGQYTRNLTDVLAMRAEISEEIGEQLRLHLSADQKRRLRTSPSESSEAYQSYLLSRYYWFKRTPEGYETSRRYLDEAIAKDPTFAASYAGLGAYYVQLADVGEMPPPEAFAKAKPLVLRALALDPDLGLGHSLLAYIMLYERDFSRAESEFKRAIELAPNWPENYGGYSVYLRAMGHSDRAIATQKHARELDPLSVAINSLLGWTFYYAHRYPEAIEQFRTSLAMDATFQNAQQGLAFAYQQSGMERDAISAWQNLLIASGNVDFATRFGNTYRQSGFQPAMALFWEATLAANSEAAKDSYVSPMVFAGLEARLKNKEDAFAWLEKAYTEGSTKLLDLKLDPDFDTLRDDPRYSDLVRRVGLP